jgi:superfamily II DNA/RNA helicase
MKPRFVPRLDADPTFCSPVQTAVVPIFLKSPSLYDSRRPPGDLCVSAPTGSGKTLAYVIPIVQVSRSTHLMVAVDVGVSC